MITRFPGMCELMRHAYDLQQRTCCAIMSRERERKNVAGARTSCNEGAIVYQPGLSFRHIRSGRVGASLWTCRKRGCCFSRTERAPGLLNAGSCAHYFFPGGWDLLGSCDVSGKGSLPAAVVLGM
jgi:hypothetical protein